MANSELGVEVLDVRVKKIELPTEVNDSVYNRMRTERERLAQELRAEGNEIAEEIRANADKERTVILADAYKTAEIIKANIAITNPIPKDLIDYLLSCLFLISSIT